MEETTMQTTTLTAEGIVCGGCASSVKKALGTLAGVTEVKVDVPEKRVTVTHDEQVARPAIVDTLTKAGFQPA
jgi:copper chaperone CopZ